MKFNRLSLACLFAILLMTFSAIMGALAQDLVNTKSVIALADWFSFEFFLLYLLIAVSGVASIFTARSSREPK